jgi:ribosome maturation factor RimP
MINETQIKEIANQYLVDFPTLFLVDVKVGIGNRIKVRVDSDESVLVQDCRALSKFIESNLDREKEDFELEVSSAGIDFPLTNIRQYIKNIGRSVQVLTVDGSTYKGKLLAATESEIEVANEKKEKGKKVVVENTTVDFNKIKETKIVISFM